MIYKMQLSLVTGPLPRARFIPMAKIENESTYICIRTIRKYPKVHSLYLSDSGDTFLPLIHVRDGNGFKEEWMTIYFIVAEKHWS